MSRHSVFTLLPSFPFIPTNDHQKCSTNEGFWFTLINGKFHSGLSPAVSEPHSIGYSGHLAEHASFSQKSPRGEVHQWPLFWTAFGKSTTSLIKRREDERPGNTDCLLSKRLFKTIKWCWNSQLPHGKSCTCLILLCKDNKCLVRKDEKTHLFCFQTFNYDDKKKWKGTAVGVLRGLGAYQGKKNKTMRGSYHTGCGTWWLSGTWTGLNERRSSHSMRWSTDLVRGPPSRRIWEQGDSQERGGSARRLSSLSDVTKQHGWECLRLGPPGEQQQWPRASMTWDYLIYCQQMGSKILQGTQSRQTLTG